MDPLKEVLLDTKLNQLVKNNFPVGNVKSTLGVNKCYHTGGGEAGVKVHQAVMGTPLWQETI